MGGTGKASGASELSSASLAARRKQVFSQDFKEIGYGSYELQIPGVGKGTLRATENGSRGGEYNYDIAAFDAKGKQLGRDTVYDATFTSAENKLKSILVRGKWNA